MHYDFIEVGTSNFNTEIGLCPDETVGLSIEPLFERLLELPSKPKVTKVTAALSDKDGFCNMYYVDPEKLKAFYPEDFNPHDYNQRSDGLPEDDHHRYHQHFWSTIGSARMHTYHNFVRGLGEQYDYEVEDITSIRQCAKISIGTLISTYLIETVDFLKIDTEGHDFYILREWMKLANNNKAPFPKTIVFETHPAVVTKDVVQQILSLLSKNGYAYKDAFIGNDGWEWNPCGDIEARHTSHTEDSYTPLSHG